MRLLRLRIKHALYLSLAIVAGVDVALFVYVTVARHLIPSTGAFIRGETISEVGSPPSGYSDEGEKIPAPKAGHGWAVRYTTPECEFSRADRTPWSSLEGQLVARGYWIYEIAPRTGNLKVLRTSKETGKTHIAFVDVGWMKRYRLTATPTTVIFNERGKIVWTHVGTMGQDDQKSAVRALFWNR